MPTASYTIDDFGVGVDFQLRLIELADTASFDDLYRTPPTTSYALSVADTAAAADATLDPALRATESAACSQVASLDVTHTLAESGSFLDLFGFVLTADDTATGTELALAPCAFDAGVAADTTDRDITLAEAGTGVELVGDRNIELIEDVTGEDEVFDKAHTLFDNFLAMDDPVWGPVAEESASASEDTAQGRLIRDRATGVETADQDTGDFTADDVTQATYEEWTLVVVVSADDTATLAETAVLTAELLGEESASGGDQNDPTPASDETALATEEASLEVSLTAGSAAVESGQGLEESTLEAVLSLEQSASGSEAGSLEAVLSLDQSASGSDELSPTLSADESPTGVDDFLIEAVIDGEDTGQTLDESGSLVATLSADETGSGEPEASLVVEYPVAESATAEEAGSPTLGQDDYATAEDLAVVGQLAEEVAAALEAPLAPLAEEVATGVEAVDYGPVADEQCYGADEAFDLTIGAEELGLGTFFATPALADELGYGLDLAALLPPGADEYPIASEGWLIEASIPGDEAADASGTIWEETLLETTDAGDEVGVGADTGEMSVVRGGDEVGLFEEDSLLEAEPEANPPEEAFGLDEGFVEALLDCEDDADSETTAYWLPTGATVVPVEARESRLERELELQGG